MGGGVAILDANSDGRMDVFFVNGARVEFPHSQGTDPDKSRPEYWNRLYLNRGGLVFEDATERFGLQGRGYGMGAAVGDIDNDGDADLLVTQASTGEVPAATLYRNHSGERFEDVTAEAGIAARGWATSAGFFDADNDGDLDLMILRYMRWRFDIDRRCGMEASYGRSYCHPDLFPGESSLLYLNRGDGRFSDASEASGISEHPGKGLGLAFADYDQDGLSDIFVANDSHPQFLFRNLGDGRFAEDGLAAGVAYNDHGDEFAGMGALFEDLDGDGLPDVLVTNLSQERYALFLNAGNRLFDYATATSGLGAATQLFAGWGLAALDVDADGHLELFFANGHVMDNIGQSQPHVRYRQRPLLFTVRGRQLRDVSAGAGPIFGASWASRGAAAGDLDGDAVPDLVVSNLGGRPYVALSDPPEGNRSIAVRLRGCSSAGGAIGARVTLELPSGSRMHRTVTRGGSYLSSRDPRVFFGVGTSKGPFRLRVRWPGGARTETSEAEPGKVLHLLEDPACGPR